MNVVPSSQARTAGVLYLVTHVTSVGAVVAYHADAIRAGVTLEFALALGCVGTGVLLWELLRHDAPVRAATFALLRTVEAAAIIVGSLGLLATVLLPAGQALADVAQPVHTASFLLGQGLVISVNTVVLGSLLWDSAAVPRPLAALGCCGGVLVLASNLGQLWGVIPLAGAAAAVAAIPVFVFEIWLAIYLITFGLRPRETDRASAVVGVA